MSTENPTNAAGCSDALGALRQRLMTNRSVVYDWSVAIPLDDFVCLTLEAQDGRHRFLIPNDLADLLGRALREQVARSEATSAT